MLGKPTKSAHEIPHWVNMYSEWDFLLVPENIVFERLRSQLSEMRMLDIGVGGGRTACHFAQATKEYVGIDFDSGMIEACRKRFASFPKKVTFLECNAKSMSIFKDGYFDFILFSFNGLDYLSHNDRLKALREIRRVGKPGGYFLVSSHNLRAIDHLFAGVSELSVRFRKHPAKFLSEVYANRALLNPLWKYLSLRYRNPTMWNIRKLRSKDYAIIYDGVYSETLKFFLLSTWKHLGHYYYIKPEAQIQQLEEAGFKVVDVYASDTRFDGRWVDRATELHAVTDCWLYYFCEIADSGVRAVTSTAA
jgi:ubiquinone/menaquinone biosynthesis C-methylase UbiE